MRFEARLGYIAKPCLRGKGGGRGAKGEGGGRRRGREEGEEEEKERWGGEKKKWWRRRKTIVYVGFRIICRFRGPACARCVVVFTSAQLSVRFILVVLQDPPGLLKHLHHG